MATRIYAVKEDGKDGIRLVRASSQPQAINHVVKSTYKAEVPTQDELVKAMQAGIAVEIAGEAAGK